MALLLVAFVLVCWQRPALRAAAGAQAAVPGPGPAEQASLRVRLSGFTDDWREDWTNAPFEPRWSRVAFPLIRTPDDCARLWRTHVLSDEKGWSGLRLSGDKGEIQERYVKTCEQWRKGLNAGLFAMSTYDMREESTFIHWSGMLETLPHLRSSVKSSFRGLDLTRLALEIEPPRVDREGIARDPAVAERRVVRGNMMRREDDGFFEWDEPVAFGDLDGDGWEDMLIISGGGASQGTMCSYGCYAVARRADGLIVSIAGRMPDGLVPARVMEARRAEWRANFGLPVNEWIELRGTCGCGPIDLADRVHPLRVRLRSEGGYLSGSYSCDLNPRDVRLAGALWTKDEGMLHEFGIDRCATATIGFDWSVEGGCLSIKGRRCGSGHIETDDWSASGPLRKESLGGQAR